MTRLWFRRRGRERPRDRFDSLFDACRPAPLDGLTNLLCRPALSKAGFSFSSSFFSILPSSRATLAYSVVSVRCIDPVQW